MVLNSKPYPGKDFKLIDSSLTKNNFTTIQIKDKNPHLYRFVYCLSKTDTGDSLLNANDSGIIILPDNQDTINLLSELSPERISGFIVDHTKSNSYIFGFEPWALEVFFKNFTLQFVKGHLEGTHPLLKDGKYTYVKEE